MVAADILMEKLAKDLILGLTVVVSKGYLANSLQLSLEDIDRAVEELETIGYVKLFTVASPDLLRLKMTMLP